MTKAEKAAKVAEFREARAKLKSLEKQYQDVGKDFFKDECRRLFEEHKWLVDFGWRQYTPYFNDGEPCEFRCYADEPTVNGYDSYSGEEPDDPDQYPALTEAEREALTTAVRKFLADYGETELKAWFGDHVVVRVDRKGVHVEEYGHD